LIKIRKQSRRSVQYCAAHLLCLAERPVRIAGFDNETFCVSRSLAVMKLGCNKEEEKVKEKNKEFRRIRVKALLLTLKLL
jgi:hypothetical protein